MTTTGTKQKCNNEKINKSILMKPFAFSIYTLGKITGKLNAYLNF